MGKGIYTEDKRNTTTGADLKKICNKLITASLKSKINVNVEFNVNIKDLEKETVHVVFFNNGDNFSMTLYSFYSQEYNTKILNSALSLMKDHSKYKEIKEYQHELFSNRYKTQIKNKESA